MYSAVVLFFFSLFSLFLLIFSLGSLGQVVYKNLNPKWLQSKSLSLKAWPQPGQRCPLRLEVWDRDKSLRDDFMGRAEIDLNRFRDGAEHELVLPLQDVASGTIRIVVQVRRTT